MAEKDPLSAKEAATILGTDARTLRKFLRSKQGLVGQGNRWLLSPSKKAMDALRKEFEAWNKTKSQGKKVTPVLNVSDDNIDEDEEVEDITELELDDETDSETEDEELEELIDTEA